jgi:hypothetical protein
MYASFVLFYDMSPLFVTTIKLWSVSVLSVYMYICTSMFSNSKSDKNQYGNGWKRLQHQRNQAWMSLYIQIISIKKYEGVQIKVRRSIWNADSNIRTFFLGYK